ncbi:putative tyrosine-protein kinase Wsck isoform X2 [Agrilus planipennis]|uniref:Tyrosine-protein kinase Wsck isoform X2 n=1 Tax=Agrilus planipennis TaxID=224129 RepID=A0A1W4X9K0_AGRPL|nr:putative tyrosine-protein kinase Wsck isoform X2 [Agrilus planipennis]
MLLFLLLIFLQSSICVEKGDLVGCFKPGVEYFIIKESRGLLECLSVCVENNNYRYAVLNNVTSKCGCTNFLGKNYSQIPCDESCHDCNIYYAGNFAPTMPENLAVENVTNTSAYILWEKPKFFLDIRNYQVKANVIKTYANYIGNPQWWTFTNNTYDAELGSLNPGTKYNILVQALSSYSDGEVASIILQTEIGDPDNIPFLPTVIKREGSKITVKLNPVMNNNGPVTSYQVVVIDQDSKLFFQPESLKSFQESKEDELGYYIAAELQPKQVLEDFVVGDGKTYGGFYNAPLNPNSNYLIIEGMVSSAGNITKVVYSDISTHVYKRDKTNLNSNSSVLVTALTICVVIVSGILAVIVIFYIYLRQKAFKRRLRRLRDNQELAMQGPILEVVNEGYIPEEEVQPIDHYNVLKQKVWRIPQNLLKVDNKTLVGVGEFGSVHSGMIKKEDDIPVVVVVIYDKKLSSINKKNMLRDLDLLIKTDKHKNVLELIGLCETMDILFVVLEAASVNLKDLLLGSRDTSGGRFSSITENQAVSFMIDIAKGIQHLEKQKVLHKRLCARNILVNANNVAKVSGYGLCHYTHQNIMPDYTRWTAVEIFSNFPHTHKSNAWSFACIMWEISALGGTPYGSIPNNEIPGQIKRGLRLVQLPYISEELYQQMFDCWQVEPGERPDSSAILQMLTHCQVNSLPLLNFELYPGFQYEQFYMDSELVARTVPIL